MVLIVFGGFLVPATLLLVNFGLATVLLTFGLALAAFGFALGLEALGLALDLLACCASHRFFCTQ